MAGKTLGEVGRSVGMSYSTVGRIERAALPSATVTQLARIAAFVGLDVRVRAYPGPSPLRDASQIALFDRFRARLSPKLDMRTEREASIGRRWVRRMHDWPPSVPRRDARVLVCTDRGWEGQPATLSVRYGHPVHTRGWAGS